ncbi:MAG: AI-2E family transporter [Candidatus Paceibacterota bacterium]
MRESDPRHYFLVVLIIGMTALVSAVFLPFLKTLALAVVFAVVLERLYTRISKILGGWESVSALMTVLIGIFFIALPLSLVGVLVGNEAHSLYISLETEQGQGALTENLVRIGDTYDRVIPGIKNLLVGVSTDIDMYLKEALRWIAGHASEIFSSVSQFFLSFLVFLIALYYLLRDGKRAREVLVRISPLPNHEDGVVLDKLERAVNSIIKGDLTLALIQGLLTTLGFLIFGVPGAVLWGTVAAVAALIPGIGTSIVIAPAVIYLFSIGNVPESLGLLAWGAIGVGLIDNLLGPKLIGNGMRLHPLLVLLAVLGGILFFGPSGVFLGPLSLSFLFALLSIYSIDRA